MFKVELPNRSWWLGSLSSIVMGLNIFSLCCFLFTCKEGKLKKCSHGFLLVRVDLFSTRVSLVDYFSRKFSLDDIFSYCFQHGPIQSMWTFFQLTKNWLESGVISKIWLTFVPSSFWSNISLPGLKFPKVWYLHFQFAKYYDVI